MNVNEVKRVPELNIVPIIENIRSIAQERRLADIREKIRQVRQMTLTAAMGSAGQLPKVPLAKFRGKFFGLKRPLAYVFYVLYLAICPIVNLLWGLFKYLDAKSGKEIYVLEAVQTRSPVLESIAVMLWTMAYK